MKMIPHDSHSNTIIVGATLALSLLVGVVLTSANTAGAILTVGAAATVSLFLIASTRPAATSVEPAVSLAALSLLFLPIVLIEPSPSDLLIVLTCNAIVFARTSAYVGAFTRTTLYVWLLLFAFSNVPSLFTSSSPGHSLFYLGTTTLMLAYAMVGQFITLQNRLLETALTAYVLGALLSTTVALALFFAVGSNSPIALFGRLKGFFKDPNVMAPYLIPALLVLISCFPLLRLPRTFANTPFRYFSISILLAGIALSFSRGAWANLLVAVLAMLLSQSLQRPRTLLVLAGGLVSALLFLQFGGLPLLFRIDPTGLLEGRLGLEAYDQDRFAAQWKALRESAEHILLGHGPGTTESALSYATHSTYLRLLFETGLIGASIFLVILGVAIWSSWRTGLTAVCPEMAKLGTVIFASLMGLIANSIIIDSLHWRHFWLLIGLGWGMSLLKTRQCNQPALSALSGSR